MIKKLIFLIVLAGAGYVGYLVWNNLTEKEKASVTKKVKDTAKDAADTITDTIRSDDEPEKKVTRDQLDPPPRQPGKVVVPME